MGQRGSSDGHIHTPCFAPDNTHHDHPAPTSASRFISSAGRVLSWHRLRNVRVLQR